MKKHFASSVALCLLFAGLGFTTAGTAWAQQTAGVTPPPKVLLIETELLKPGQQGSQHQKSERAFVDAFTAAKWPTHYLAMNALSGKLRAVFFIGYDSFDAWQKDDSATRKDPTLSAALDSAGTADGQLLESNENSTYIYREDLSLRAPVDISQTRYFEITIYQIRPGHRQDWNALVKMYITANEKMPSAHWATYEKWYGTDSGGRYITITPMKSLAEVDQEQADMQQFRSTLSEDDQKKMADLTASTIESEENNMFAVNPQMSYVADSWIAADPAFWGQK